MKWDRDHNSNFIEDRRGASGGRSSRGGGMGGGLGILFALFRRFGWKGALVGAIALGGLYYCGGSGLLSSAGSAVGGGAVDGNANADDQSLGIQDSAGEAGASPAKPDKMKAFIGFVLDDAQTTWTKVFADRGETYRPAYLVLFTGSTDTSCGRGTAATGPFYCPADEKVYIDLSFYQQLQDRLGAPGDFAQAYVIAHEIGHHVQHIYKVLGKGRDEGAEGGSVRVELQADCYAGIWAKASKQRDLLESGDIEEALKAAHAIGDDTLQQQATGTVRPETFSHGTSEQRMRWFRKGLETGSVDACNTFTAARL